MSIQGHKGRIIVLEGLDKSGKTTQADLLYHHFRKSYSEKVILLSFPDYSTPIGKLIRDFLDEKVDLDKETFHLLLAANRREKRKIIKGYLDKGAIIIMNRYYHSNLAYGIANGISKDWLLSLDKGMPKEDLTFVLDVKPEISQLRTIKNNFNPDVFERNLEFLNQTRTNYLNLAGEYGWVVIESAMSRETVFSSLVNIITEKSTLSY